MPQRDTHLPSLTTQTPRSSLYWHICWHVAAGLFIVGVTGIAGLAELTGLKNEIGPVLLLATFGFIGVWLRYYETATYQGLLQGLQRLRPLFHSVPSRNRSGLQEQAEDLARGAHLVANWLDPQYRENYARAHTQRILTKEGPRWEAQYLRIMRDRELVALLESDYPHVLATLEALREVILLAERIAVEPPPLRHKRTPDEWREQAVNVVKTQTRDEAAKFFGALESMLEVQDALEAREQEIREREDLTAEQQEARLQIIQRAAEAHLHALQSGTKEENTDEANSQRPTILS